MVAVLAKRVGLEADRALAPLAAPLGQAMEVALDWAQRSRAAVAMLALHLSRLHAPGPRPHHRRIAASLLEGTVQARGGQVFACPNGDYVLLTEPQAAVQLVATLSHLFRVESPGADRLVALWSLPADEAAARAYFLLPTTAPAVMEERPVPLGAVAAVDAVLAAMPIDELVRRQTAVLVTPGGLRPAYRELSVSLAALESRVGMPVPFTADPFLFRHLAARLDRRVLATRGLLDGPLPMHLNLTVPSVLSPAFAALASTLPQHTALGVEIALMEAVADPAAFAAASCAVRAAGGIVVVDGVDHAALALARPAALAPDLLKLNWSPRLAQLPSREWRLVSQALGALGMERVVLNRAESEAALAWGLARGIRRFQGRHVDAMLAAERLSTCAYAHGCTLRQCLSRAAASGPAGRSGCQDTARLDGWAKAPAFGIA